MKEKSKTLPMTRAGFLIISAILLSRSLVFAQTKPNVPLAGKSSAPIPIVGCESRVGNSDDSEPPRVVAPGSSKVFPVNASTAQRLSFYQLANGFGVLAPHGWYCYGIYGSSGGNLYVSQELINANTFSHDLKGFSGSVIDVTTKSGGTSGRFEVAQTIARVFPAHMSFVRNVIAEGTMPASSFPTAPYPRDTLAYLSKEVVEFHTPANTEGLGTVELPKNGSPISGVTMLVGQDPDLLQLSVRLSTDTNDLTQVILQQFERDALKTEVIKRQHDEGEAKKQALEARKQTLIEERRNLAETIWNKVLMITELDEQFRLKEVLGYKMEADKQRAELYSLLRHDHAMLSPSLWNDVNEAYRQILPGLTMWQASHAQSIIGALHSFGQ
jgi:hypothetical protein